MQVFNTLSLTYVNKSVGEVSRNVYLGMLYTYLDKIYELKKKREIILQETYDYLWKTKRYIVKPTFKETPMKTLIKFSNKRLYGVGGEEDNLLLELRMKYRVDINRDTMEYVVKRLINNFKHGFSNVPTAKVLVGGHLVQHKVYGYCYLYTFSEEQIDLTVPKVKKKAAEVKELPVETKEVKPEIKVREVFVKDIIEEDDVYRGSLFKVEAFQQLATYFK